MTCRLPGGGGWLRDHIALPDTVYPCTALLRQSHEEPPSEFVIEGAAIEAAAGSAIFAAKLEAARDMETLLSGRTFGGLPHLILASECTALLARDFGDFGCLRPVDV